MRLLQLATGPGEYIDLHPNVSVIAGLDEEGRLRLTEAVIALARGRVSGPPGLLEAHGVLFDLSADMLALLDIHSPDLRPVVVPEDLPTARDDPLARERTLAERALTAAEERWAAANEDQARAQAALAASTEAVDRARRALAESESDAAGRVQSIDTLTAQLEHAIERRRQLAQELAELAPRAAAASAERDDVEAATAEVRNRRQEAAARCTELAGRLEQARMGLDPHSVPEAEHAAQALAVVEAEVEAERRAEAEAEAEQTPAEEAPAEWVERLEQRIEELEKRLAAFGPADVHDVANALEQVRSLAEPELVPVPEAMARADELVALEAELVATSPLEGVPLALPEARARLDDARQALLEAEQAVRNPELDRELVHQLEEAHAELLDAIDKADGRFAGARAQQRVEALRSAEHALLDAMGFTSYSDYMMGYSLLHVDPAKEETLDDARAELSAAEDAWKALREETDAELARAELMERRRGLIEDARALIGRPVPVSAVVDELRALRVEAEASPEVALRLRRALDAAGLALGDEDLESDDLVLVAEAWLAEAADATIREQAVRSDRVALIDERAEARAALEALAAEPEVAVGPAPEDLRTARLIGARGLARATAERRAAHDEAQALVSGLEEELARAANAEELARQAAAEADALVSATASHGEVLLADLRRLDQDLEAATLEEAEGQERLRVLSESVQDLSPERLAQWMEEAEAAFLADQQSVSETTRAAGELAAQREQAAEALAAMGAPVTTDGLDETSVAEEIEWYLLARLAAQRSGSLGGSLPLLVDDALGGLDEVELGHVLGRLERMAEAVQVIVMTDDPLASSWALTAGVDRAALVRPQPS